MKNNFQKNYKNLTKTDYIKIPLQIEASTSLNSTQKRIYYHLLFRMRLSISKGHHYYYDPSRHQHYVIYKVTDLAHNLGLSSASVIRNLKKLETKGFIERVRKIHRTLIFLPRYNQDTPYQPYTPHHRSRGEGTKPTTKASPRPTSHNATSRSDISKDNKMTSLVRTKKPRTKIHNYTSNTINTENRENSKKPNQDSSNLYLNSTSKPKSQESTWNSADNQAVRFELLHQRLGLPKAAASEMITDVGDDYYEWCHILISAKQQAMKYVKDTNQARIKQKSALNKYHFESKRNASWFKKAFRFEDNEYFKGRNNDYGSHQNHLYYSSNDNQLSKTFGSLANQIRRGLWKAIHKITKPSKKYKTTFAARAAYFAKSMRGYLIEAATSYIDKHCRPIADPIDRNLPRIPIFKL